MLSEKNTNEARSRTQKRRVRSKKKPSCVAGFLNRSLTMTYSHMGTPTLPSAMLRFTSEFGMGSGGSKALWSSGKTVCRMMDFLGHPAAILRVFNRQDGFRLNVLASNSL